jgi:uncharacterized protein YdeI (YjbR/CyaY-like superfamily)
MNQSDELPILFCEKIEDWSNWLSQNAMASKGVRLRLYKKQSGVRSITYAEALDVALCHGWIDSRKNAYDELSWLQIFTPRKKKSIWSKINKEKVERFMAQGIMTPQGLETVEEAKRNGQWDKAYEGQKNMTVPDDLQLALNDNEKANAFFQTLDATNRYAILFRLNKVSKPDKRSEKIQNFIQMLENGEKFYN